MIISGRHLFQTFSLKGTDYSRQPLNKGWLLFQEIRYLFEGITNTEDGIQKCKTTSTTFWTFFNHGYNQNFTNVKSNIRTYDYLGWEDSHVKGEWMLMTTRNVKGFTHAFYSGAQNKLKRIPLHCVGSLDRSDVMKALMFCIDETIPSTMPRLVSIASLVQFFSRRAPPLHKHESPP